MRIKSSIVGVLRAARGEAWYRYRLAERIAGWIYPSYKFSEYGRTWLDDEEFLEYYRSFHPDNWHSLDRKYVLAELLKLVENVPGDTVELGVYRGASSWLICAALRGSVKHHHVFDSFQGLSTPDGRDGSYWRSGDMQCSEQQFRARLQEFDNYVVHAGWIPQRFPEVEDRRFSFVHIDVDLYQPTLDSIAFFYPRTTAGGAILLDDYGFATCPGARAAVDEYMQGRSDVVLNLPTGQGLILPR
jgi:hypothetical protein